MKQAHDYRKYNVRLTSADWQRGSGRVIKDGIHGRIITVIRSLYSCLRSCVKVPEGLTEFFRCTVGTRQGCLLDELGCPGMRIDEAFSNVSLLMYADDIALMNDTIGRLQNSIDILSTFCDKYGLKVNMSKTNVIIFRNGGPIRHNEHVFHRGAPILCVTYYKYLGMMFCVKALLDSRLTDISITSRQSNF